MTVADDPLGRTGEEPALLRRALASPTAVPCLLVIAAVVLGNVVYLTGLFDPNPMNQYSNLAVLTRQGILPGQNNIDPNQGFVSQALGHLAAYDWLHGHIPWWNPFEGLGMPLAGEMQSAALFLPLVLFDAFANGQIFFRLVLELTAGLSMLFLLRRLVTSRWAATAGAVAFALNGTFAWMFHAPGNPVAFAPLLLLGIEQARTSASRTLAGWPLIAIALAGSIYAGFPEVAFIDFLLAVLWAAVRATELRGGDLLGYVRRLVAGAVTGTLLAAPILVAFLTFTQSAALLDHGGNGFLNTWMRPSVALPSLLMPYVYGPPFSWLSYSHGSPTLINFWGNIGGYLDASLFVLGLIALPGKPERRLRLVLGLWLLLAIGRTVGMPGARQIINAIPGVKQTAFYRYSPPSWTLALAILAAFAIDDMAKTRAWKRAAIAAGVAFGATALLAQESSFLHRAISGAPHHRAWQYGSVALAVLVILICVGGSALRRPGIRAGLLSTVVAAEALGLFIVPELAAPRSAVIDTAPVRFLQSHLGLQRYFTLGPIAPNYGSYWRIPTITLNDVPIVKSYAEYIPAHLNANTPPALFTGTVTSRPGPSPTQEFIDHFSAYEATGVKYVILPQGAPVPAVGGRGLPVVFSDRLAQIVELPHPAPFQSTEGGNCDVAVSSQTQAVVQCSGPGTLIRREQYLPGWSATDSGQTVEVTSYQSVFQSVKLRPGRNVLLFSFAPPHTGLGIGAFGLGAVIMIGAALNRTATGRWLLSRIPRGHRPVHRRKKGDRERPAGERDRATVGSDRSEG